MKSLKFILSVFLLSSLQASSLVKVVCDMNNENIYLDGKFKTECSNDELVKLLVRPGEHIVKVLKNNKDKSYYVYKENFRIGDGVEKLVEVNTHIVYTKDYYYKRAYKSLKDAKIFISKYTNSNEAIKIKNYWENRYWKNCNSLNGCQDYLSEIPWKKHIYQAKSKLEKYYYQKAKNDISYAWKYLRKYPNGKYVRNIKTLLDNYYYKRCNDIDSCETYLNKITWDKYRAKKVKLKLEKLYKNYALDYNKYDVYLNKYSNGKYKNEVLEEKYYYEAKINKTGKSFLRYLRRYPHGKYAKQVRFWLNNTPILIKTFYTKGIATDIYKVAGDVNKTLMYGSDGNNRILFSLKNNVVEWVINDIPYISSHRLFMYGHHSNLLAIKNIVLLTADKDLSCINISNEKLLWHIKFDGYIYKIKHIGNNIYVLHLTADNYPNPAITKIDIKTGKVISSIEIKNINFYSGVYRAMDFDIKNHILAITLTTYYNKWGVLLYKFDKNGNIIWKKKVDDDSTSNVNLITLNDGNDLINITKGLVKFDKNGNIIWTKDNIYIYKMIKLNNGIVVGLSGDMRLYTFDKNGDLFWSHKWNSNNYTCRDIGVDENGNILVVGQKKYWYQPDGWAGYEDGYEGWISVFKFYKEIK